MITAEPRGQPSCANGDELERLAAYDLLACDILTVRERSDQEVIWANASLRREWQLFSDASRGQCLHWHELVHKEDRPGVLGCYQALRAGHPARLSYRVLLPDGRLRYCEETAKVSMTPRGQSRLLALTRDVTVQHDWRLEQRRREALEAQLIQTEQAVPGVFVRHVQWPDGRAQTELSPAALARAEGLPEAGPDGSIGDLFTLIHPDDRPGLQQKIETFEADGAPLRLACRVRHLQQGWRWAELRLWPQAEAGARGSCSGFLQYITPRQPMDPAI